MTAAKLAILRIELLDIEPLIWRRVAVRDATNLAALHKIIQAAMGWLDYHLWEFTVDDVPYGVPDPDGMDWVSIRFQPRPRFRVQSRPLLGHDWAYPRSA